MNSAIRISLVGLAAAGMLLPAVASAQFKNQGYLLDSAGNPVRAVGAGVCVRTSEWTPARAIEECDPDLVPKKAPPPKPKEKAKPEAKPEAKAKPKIINIEEKIE